MSVREECEELLRKAEKLLREADSQVEWLKGTNNVEAFRLCKRRRNAINAACNALHRATKA